MSPKLFLIVPATPCLSILTRGMCHCATTNYFRLQSGATVSLRVQEAENNRSGVWVAEHRPVPRRQK